MAILGALFTVVYGNKFDLNKMTPNVEGIAFVGRRRDGQGISGFVEPMPGVEPFEAGLLTVALGGSYVLATFVQQQPFYTAQNVAVLTPKEEMSIQERLYYSMCIEANRYRYTAFGREANRTLRTLELPDAAPAWVDEAEVPDLPAISTPVAAPTPLTDPASWSWFRLGDLFDIKRGKYIPKAQQKAGTTPTITSTSTNNGLSKFLDIEPLFEAGSITVARNGSVGEAFFQPVPFFASDDVHVFVPKRTMSPLVSMFICTVIRREAYRYGYGRKWSLSRMGDTQVRLPSTDQGQPNWTYMESFMRGQRYSAAV